MQQTLTARQLAKCDARHRVYRRFYATFDAIPPACRAALREDGGWDAAQLRKCFGYSCQHNPQQPH
jgi:hypothetical protein